MKCIRESISDVFHVRVEIICEENSIESYTSIDGFWGKFRDLVETCESIEGCQFVHITTFSTEQENKLSWKI